MREAVMEDLRDAFRPEFLNRLDETIIFHRLDRAQLRSIVDVQLAGFEKRLAERDMRSRSPTQRRTSSRTWATIRPTAPGR